MKINEKTTTKSKRITFYCKNCDIEYVTNEKEKGLKINKAVCLKCKKKMRLVK